MWTRFILAMAACIELLLPSVCLLCGALISHVDSEPSFCQGCLAGMPPLSPGHCRRCAQPFADGTANHLCGVCLKRPPAFASVQVAGLYQGGIKEAVQRLKYRNQLTLATPLGQLLGRTIATGDTPFSPSCIVPVPLHPQRLRQRGYNQALEVARPIARQLGVPLEVNLLQRIRRTPPQQGLSATERSRNMRNAFALTSPSPEPRILLIDDVMTTGATAHECCLTLLAGGVEEVQVAVVGRA